jgi:hypothetical protein
MNGGAGNRDGVSCSPQRRDRAEFRFMHYNLCRVHQTLRVIPAMEAGIADHIWLIEEVVCLLQSNGRKAA